MRDGIERLQDELSEKGLTEKRLAERTLVRIQTSTSKAAFKSAAEMGYGGLYSSECWQTGSTWTLFTKFYVYGAMEAHRRKRR